MNFSGCKGETVMNFSGCNQGFFQGDQNKRNDILSTRNKKRIFFTKCLIGNVKFQNPEESLPFRHPYLSTNAVFADAFCHIGCRPIFIPVISANFNFLCA